MEHVIDATNMDFEDNSIDVLIASQTIHHFCTPMKFFDDALRVVKNNGYILIQEINTSLMMRTLLYIMHHEGWSYDIDVFNRNIIANDPRDVWSANCAIPELLFSNIEEFEEKSQVGTTYWKVIRNQLCECLIFPLSGGVIAKTKVPRLPQFVLKCIDAVDSLLVALLPQIFALGRSVVLQKRTR